MVFRTLTSCSLRWRTCIALRCACRSTNISETSGFGYSMRYIVRLMMVSSTEKHETDNLTFQLIPSPLKHRLEDMFQRPGHTMRTLNYCRILATTSFITAALVTAGFGPAGAADPTGDWRDADGVANIR